MAKQNIQPELNEAAEIPPGVRFFDRAARALRELTGAARLRLTGSVRPDLPDEDREQLRIRILACVAARSGEVSARAQAADIGRIYLELSQTGRQRFLCLLAEQFGCNHDAVRQASAAVLAAETPDSLTQAEHQLRRLLEPQRIQLLKRFNSITGGVKFLVDLHADVLRFQRSAPTLAPLANDLRELLTSWFDAGFLELRSIDWSAPAALLEKLIAYEAVHAILSWDDLKNRLDSDRRCFAFFHPAMPDEPLIFVEVALVNGMASTIHELLDEAAAASDPETADTAIFYSISNAQAGLAGVSFGEFLIKRVVHELSQNFPNLKTFATLSPIPGFAGWLASNAADICATLPVSETLSLTAMSGSKNAGEALLSLLADPEWPNDPRKERVIQPLLMQLCVRYLLDEKRGDGRAKDPVTHFHLSNGARVERINWLGDKSPNGMRQSHALMVNYLYKLSDIEKNHERYTNGHIPASSTLRKKH